MRVVFADTGYWVALLNPHDDLHSKADKAWSQTDCASFKIMEEYRILEALACEKHFAQAGFVPLMRD